MDTYRNTAAYLKNNPLVIVKVIGITFIQRMALFAVTWFVYQAFWTPWNRFLGYPFSPGSDIGICGYAAASGRNGNQ